MRLTATVLAGAALCVAEGVAQTGKLTTTAAVLERYQQALGGTDAIKMVQSETIRGEIEASGETGRAKFEYYAKPSKTLIHVTRPDGTEIRAGFDGSVSWTVTPKGASIDKDTPLGAVRRDADLQYPLHQPDYFEKLELAGVQDFEGHSCYWLHGTTLWGKDNNQFYDVKTGLLAGYRFQIDAASGNDAKNMAIAVFENYKKFGGPRVATRTTSRAGGSSQTFIYQSVSYDPLPDAVFDLPEAVKVLMK